MASPMYIIFTDLTLTLSSRLKQSTASSVVITRYLVISQTQHYPIQLFIVNPKLTPSSFHLCTWHQLLQLKNLSSLIPSFSHLPQLTYQQILFVLPSKCTLNRTPSHCITASLIQAIILHLTIPVTSYMFSYYPSYLYSSQSDLFKT